jgi:hypothetical protein
MVSDPHRFNADPNPAFCLIADQVPFLGNFLKFFLSYPYSCFQDLLFTSIKKISSKFVLQDPDPDPDLATQINSEPSGSEALPLKLLKVPVYRSLCQKRPDLVPGSIFLDLSGSGYKTCPSSSHRKKANLFVLLFRFVRFLLVITRSFHAGAICQISLFF